MRPHAGQTLAHLLSFYRLDAVANSNAEFGMRGLTLASSSAPVPHRWGGYPGNITSIGTVELNSNQDAFTRAVTLGTTIALAYTSSHVITIVGWNTSFASTVWNSSLRLLTLLNPTLGGGSIRTGICPPIGMAP